MGKIAYFQSTDDWCNKQIVLNLGKLGNDVEVIPIQGYVLDLGRDSESWDHDLYVNRIYPSSTYEGVDYTKLSLEITNHLESIEKKVVNSFPVTFADYSKSESISKLRSLEVNTPQSWMMADKEAALKLGKELDFPKIIKMDTGGRALNVSKADNFEQFEKTINDLVRSHHNIHVEDFYKPPGFVTRVFILGYSFQAAYKRIVAKGEWLGSRSQGSTIEPYPNISEDIISEAEYVAKELKMPIVGFDVIESDQGNYFLDINPTPVFASAHIQLFGFDPTERIANFLNLLSK